MNLLKGFVLGLRFALELCLLATLAYWGWQLDQGWLLRLAAGLGAPLLASIIWGRFVSPRASRRLADPLRLGLELLLFGIGSALLVTAGQAVLGIILFLVFLADRLLLMALGLSRH